MKIAPKKVATPWRPANMQPPRPMQTYAFPAPLRGWVISENIAATQSASARILDNFVPTKTGLRLRRGYKLYATIDDACTAMFTHVDGSTRTFFAASADAVFDITTPADPEVAPTAEFTGQTNGDYSSVQFGTSGGQFLYIVNGADKPRLFGGATWTAIDGVSTPAITGVTTTGLSHVWSYSARLWFVEGGTMSAWVLPVDSVGGAAIEVSMAGIFRKGGALLFGASWSMDAGDGLDDKCVFVSTEGEVAVYEGPDPSDANTWAKVGLYEIPRPLGKLAYFQSGGDLLIATEVGIIRMSDAVNTDATLIETRTVSAPISSYWRNKAALLTDRSWEIVKVPAEGYALISQPGDSRCLCLNMQTGAWSRFTGWDTNCLGFHDGRAYFGTEAGTICLAEEGGQDGTAIYTGRLLGQHDSMGVYGVQKTVAQARPVFDIASNINWQLLFNTDFYEGMNGPPSAVDVRPPDDWDAGLWDEAIWDGISGYGGAAWKAIGRTGYSFAPQLQISSGDETPLTVELVAIDVQFRVGAMVA